MRIMRGSTAFSQFRIEKKLAELSRILPGIRKARADFIHFLDIDDPLTSRQEEQLAELLAYGQPANVAVAMLPACIVIPRPGMISPWSSKATDILHHCGLASLKRVERGTCWYLEFSRRTAAGEHASNWIRSSTMPARSDDPRLSLMTSMRPPVFLPSGKPAG